MAVQLRDEYKKPKNLSIIRWALKRALIGIVVLVIIVYAVIFFVRFMSNWDKELQKNYESVTLGAKASFVVEVMGEPQRVSEYRMEAIPTPGYGEMAERAVKAGAKIYYYYDNGISTIYVFGLDDKRNLVFKETAKK